LCTRLESGPGTTLRDLAKPAPVLSPEMPVRRAMQVVTDARAKLAIVVSGTRPVGIVTVKDLIEPLTGEFRAW
jgi:CBS domain containing-hemolysin-like protein